MVVGCVAVVNTFTRRVLALGCIQITLATALMGGAVQIAFELTNTQANTQSLLVDLTVYYVKASGQAKTKVFKLKTLELAPGQTARFVKKLSLAEMATRTHYPGELRGAVRRHF